MASLLQKLLRKSPPPRIITAFNNNPQAPNLTTPLFIHQPHLIETKPHHPHIINLTPSLDSPKTEDLTPSPSSHIYPSFPFGFCFNPISSTGLLLSERDDVVSGDSQVIWADSVKKKRKRKMNKHKYKKLRKRLRRKT
ncbi:hypothetical protein L1049_002106 [Liquidambar formosana]|uniref:Ribosomal protein mS38 C-terminal domain-containing protein n=1 Tax=Liquidambar formosana TaxID=63359 RepID=A0AAP0NF19_LIQFO